MQYLQKEKCHKHHLHKVRQDILYQASLSENHNCEHDHKKDFKLADKIIPSKIEVI